MIRFGFLVVGPSMHPSFVIAQRKKEVLVMNPYRNIQKVTRIILKQEL